jgi:hypothetical protein
VSRYVFVELADYPTCRCWKEERARRLVATTAPRGFEVNDGTFAPRRYEWREIEKFMLVGPWGEVEDVVVAHGKTFAEASRDGDTQAPVRVGFRYSPGHRRTVANKLLGGLRRRAKTKADGFVMGYWDRSFNEAVELMNEWLTRYKTA